MISNQRQQRRFTRIVWRFLRDWEIDVADIYELDEAMREVITSVRQAKTAEDLSHLEQFFVISDWNGNDVILASDRPMTVANRDEFCR
jgi:hexokinase